MTVGCPQLSGYLVGHGRLLLDQVNELRRRLDSIDASGELVELLAADLAFLELHARLLLRAGERLAERRTPARPRFHLIEGEGGEQDG